jgi:hypothetical protein
MTSHFWGARWSTILQESYLGCKVANHPPGESRRDTGWAGFHSNPAQTHHIAKKNKKIIKNLHTQYLSSWKVDGPHVFHTVAHEHSILLCGGLSALLKDTTEI